MTHTITEDNEWTLQYSAETDAPTIVAMTNHAYFNLNANIDDTTTVLETTAVAILTMIHRYKILALIQQQLVLMQQQKRVLLPQQEQMSRLTQLL